MRLSIRRILTAVLPLPVTIVTVSNVFLQSTAHVWWGGVLCLMAFIHAFSCWKRNPLSLLLLIALSLTTFSGLVIAVIYAPAIKGFHAACSYCFIFLLLVHLIQKLALVSRCYWGKKGEL